MIEILEPEDLYEYREAYRMERLYEEYRYDDEGVKRTDKEIDEYLLRNLEDSAL